MNNKIEAKKVLNYAENAKNKLISAFSSLEDAYDYVAPSRVNFRKISNSGDAQTANIWDSTAIAGVHSWANNVQAVLMPPQKKWYGLGLSTSLQHSNNLSETEISDIESTLQNYTDILFDNFNQSNIYSVLNESLQDLAVSTGVIAINATTSRVPFSFKAISLSEISLDEGAEGNIDRFYRDINMSVRVVIDKWGEVGEIPEWITTLNVNKPDEVIDLTEGSIEMKGRGELYYFYFVIDNKTKKYIYTEDKEYPPFIAFRMTKRPEDILGYGICQAMLPTIKMLNLIKYYYLRSNKFAAFPAYLATKSGAFNPYTAVIEAGSIIPVNPGFASEPPIAPLQQGSNLQLAGITIGELQKEVNEALFVNPLGDVSTTKNRSEGEMRMRQQNWAQQNAVGIGRLNSELIKPVISAALTILRMRGVLSDIKTSIGTLNISDTTSAISVNFNSPLVGMQDQEDAQKMIQFMQVINEMVGPSGMSAAVDMPAIPEYIAKKMGVDLDLVKTKAEVQKVMQASAQAMQQQQIEQQKAQAMAQDGSSQSQQVPYLGG